MSEWTRRRFLTATATVAAMAAGLPSDAQLSGPPGRWYGLFVPGSDMSTFEAVAAPLSETPTLGAYFVKLNSTFDTATLHRFGDRGLIPFLTLEPWNWQNRSPQLPPQFSLATFLRGDHDAGLTRIARHIAEYGQPVYLRLAHEMNGHWYPWAVGPLGNTAQQYVDFWKHVRSIFAIAPLIRWVWGGAAVQNVRRDAPAIETLWPGDDLVDLAGVTGYGRDASAQATYGPSFARLATFTGRAFLIPEMGAQAGVNAAGRSAADWTASLGPYLRRTPRIRGFVWFHISPAVGATGDYRLAAPQTVRALNTVLETVPITSGRRG